MARLKNEDAETAEVKKTLFSFEQILSSKKLGHSKDILRVVLKPDKKYSLAEVDELVRKFKERKVI